jgi:excisionase family DNA binding protein
MKQEASDSDVLLTTRQAAKLLRLSENTLEVWRVTKRYPLPYIKVGRAVRYSRASILKFLRSRTEAA